MILAWSPSYETIKYRLAPIRQVGEAILSYMSADTVYIIFDLHSKKCVLGLDTI